MKNASLALLLALALSLGALVGHVQAATQVGIAMSPAIQDKVLGPHETSTSFSVQLSNLTAKSVTFALSSTDFSALNETGGLTFLGTDSQRVTNGHGLSSILRLDTKQVTIGPNGSKQITAQIADVHTLAPGGHYAAILAQALPDGRAVQGNNVSVNQIVSSLLFLETAGQGTKTLQLLPPDVSTVSFALPQSINVVFKATGDTQTVPRGRVVITQGNTEIMEAVINENSSLLLPGSTRLLMTQLVGDRHPLRPGLYKVQVQYRYEGSLGVTTYQKTFLYVNPQAVLLALVAIIFVVYGGFRSRRFWKKLRQAAIVPAVVQKRLIVVRNRSAAAHKIIVTRKAKNSSNRESDL